MERVAALAQENALPEPTLDLRQLPPSTSTFRDIMQMPPPPTRGYSTEDPWNSKFTTPANVAPKAPAFDAGTNGAPSSISGTGLPREWWKKQETVFVNILGQQGFILNRYLVYEISSDVRVDSCSPNLMPSSFGYLSARRTRPSALLRVRILMGMFDATVPLPSIPSTSTKAGWT